MLESSWLNEEKEEGFSLVELLVVIVIIGILSAIAIVAFLNQRQKANDAAVESDLRNFVTTIETALVDYPNAKGVQITTEQGELVDGQWKDLVFGVEIYEDEEVDYTGNKLLNKVDLTLSDGVVVGILDHTVQDGYVIYGFHYNGDKYNYSKSGTVLAYNSAEGKFWNATEEELMD